MMSTMPFFLSRAHGGSIETTPKQELEQREYEHRREKTSAPSQRLESGAANGLNVEMQQSKLLKGSAAQFLPPS